MSQTDKLQGNKKSAKNTKKTQKTTKNKKTNNSSDLDKNTITDDFLDSEYFFCRHLNSYAKKNKINYEILNLDPKLTLEDYLNEKYFSHGEHYKYSISGLINDLHLLSKKIEYKSTLLLFKNEMYYDLTNHDYGNIMDIKERDEFIFKEMNFDLKEELSQDELDYYHNSKLYKFFKDSVKDNKSVELLETATAHLLFGRNSRDNIIVYVYGQGGSGKGQYAHLLESLMRVNSMDESEFTNPNVGYLDPLINCDILIIPEIEKNVSKRFNNFQRQVSGGDTITINLKGVKDKIVLTGEQTPRLVLMGENFDDQGFTTGHSQRLVVIQFKGIKRQTKIDIKDYYKKILADEKAINIFQNLAFNKVMNAVKDDKEYIKSNFKHIQEEQFKATEHGKFNSPELYLLEKYTEFDVNKANKLWHEDKIAFSNKDISNYLMELGKQYDLPITAKRSWKKDLESLHPEFETLMPNTRRTSVNGKSSIYYLGIVFMNKEERLAKDRELGEDLTEDSYNPNDYNQDYSKLL
jgi:hypothetical protein